MKPEHWELLYLVKNKYPASNPIEQTMYTSMYHPIIINDQFEPVGDYVQARKAGSNQILFYFFNRYAVCSAMKSNSPIQVLQSIKVNKVILGLLCSHLL